MGSGQRLRWRKEAQTEGPLAIEDDPERGVVEGATLQPNCLSYAPDEARRNRCRLAARRHRHQNTIWRSVRRRSWMGLTHQERLPQLARQLSVRQGYPDAVPARRSEAFYGLRTMRCFLIRGIL